MINGISVVGKNVSDIPSLVSEVTGTTGKKPNYIVVDSEFLDKLDKSLKMVKTKSGSVSRIAGMSVVIVPTPKS